MFVRLVLAYNVQCSAFFLCFTIKNILIYLFIYLLIWKCVIFRFYWEKDGVRLELSDSVKLKSAGFGTLTILNPLPLLHDGIYQCFAYNEFGVAVTTKAIVRKAGGNI